MKSKLGESDSRFLPDEAVCEECQGIRIEDPATRRMLEQEDMMAVVRPCRCLPAEQEEVERMQHRIQSANLPHRHEGQVPLTFTKLDQDDLEAYRAAIRFAQGDGPAILTLVGTTGSGKSALLEAIGRFCVEEKDPIYYSLVSELLDELRAGYDAEGPESYDALMQRIWHVGVLLLDDIGMEKRTDWACEKLTAIVDERWRLGKRLAVATNSTYDEMSKTISFRLASRLFDTQTGATKVVVLRSKDRRIGR